MFLPFWVIFPTTALVIATSAFLLRCLSNTRRGAQTFRAVAEGSSDGLVLMEQDSKIVWANAAYCRNMGYGLDELLGRYPLTFVLPDHMALPEENVRNFRFDPNEERFGKLTQVLNARKDGEEFMHEFSHAVVKTGQKTLYLLSGRDVTERMERENELIAAKARLEQLSKEDNLTGLLNRLSHYDRLAELEAIGEPFAVLQIDMNDFKSINDTYGHSAGDALLKHFGVTLKGLAEDDWHCARTGGDEFTILIPGVWALGFALGQASRLFQDVQVPLKWEAGELCPSISIGVSIFDASCPTAKDSLVRADVALYQAKLMEGERISAFDENMHRDHENQKRLQRDLFEALETGGIDFQFMPVVDLESRKLLRFRLRPFWTHTKHGHLAGPEILKIATQLCVRDTLERQMLRKAQAGLSQLKGAGLPDVGLEMEVSPASLTAAGSDDLAWFFDDDVVVPGAITLTLSVDRLDLVKAQSAIKTELRRLRGRGVQIILGNPNLDIVWVRDISDVGVNGICLGHVFAGQMKPDDAVLAVMHATSGLAHSIDSDVLVQGLSQAWQVRMLQEVGNFQMSGPVIAPAMTMTEALMWAREVWPNWSLEETTTSLSA